MKLTLGTGVDKMSEYQVQSIEEDAKKTRKSLLKRKEVTFEVSTEGMINYCDKVLFLCKMIRKLNHNK